MKHTSSTEVPGDCVSTAKEHKYTQHTLYAIAENDLYAIVEKKKKDLFGMRHIKKKAKAAGCPVVRTMAAQARDPVYNSS